MISEDARQGQQDLQLARVQPLIDLCFIDVHEGRHTGGLCDKRSLLIVIDTGRWIEWKERNDYPPPRLD